MKRDKFRIYKSDGRMERYSKKKLYRSLRHSGLSNQEASVITNKVSHEMGEGTRTRDIYRRTLSLVKEQSPVAAIQYSLKRALFDLGPTGHYFEDFVACYFKECGYSTRTCVTMRGKWVSHEVDVVAEKKEERFFVECKFHNRKGLKNDIKIALYVKARWDDLKEGPVGKNLTGFYIASNTAFTLDAITYAKGSGLRLLGVNAPPEVPFVEEIKRMKLYPITSLRRLTRRVKEELMHQGIILVKDLERNKDVLLKMGLKENEITLISKEVELLLGT